MNTPDKKVRSVLGEVVSDAMDKTITVRITRSLRHPLYGKYIRRSTKLLVHDETNQAHVGDQVRITEGRPRSKHKTWELLEVCSRATATEVLEE